jgi:hypothetical protein
MIDIFYVSLNKYLFVNKGKIFDSQVSLTISKSNTPFKPGLLTLTVTFSIAPAPEAANWVYSTTTAALPFIHDAIVYLDPGTWHSC